MTGAIGIHKTEAGSCRLTTLIADSFHTGAIILWADCDVPLIGFAIGNEWDTDSASLDAAGRSSGRSAAKPTGPRFGYVDASNACFTKRRDAARRATLQYNPESNLVCCQLSCSVL